MRWVAHAASSPHRCAAIPFIGNSSAKRGYIDTGQRINGWDPHIYISVEAVEEMARMIGWQPAHVQKGHAAKVAELEDRLARSEATKTDLERAFMAIDVLASRDFVARKKPGRPPNEKQVA
jgi:hypothetical protein